MGGGLSLGGGCCLDGSRSFHFRSRRMKNAPKDPRQFAILRARQEGRVEALSRVEGRALLDIEEQIGACMKWPHRFTEMMLSTHLRFPERWQLTLFLLGNRCPPTLMAEWFITRGMLKDKAARDQVVDLIRKHRDGSLEQQGRTTWVMSAVAPPTPVWERKHRWDGVGDDLKDKNQIIATPTFAFDWEHQWHWDEAIKMLQAPASSLVRSKSAPPLAPGMIAPHRQPGEGVASSSSDRP